MAARSPTVLNVANLFTLARLLFGGVVLGSVLRGHRLESACLFVLFALLDRVDGFLARRYRCETDFGKNFDLLVDGVVGYAVLVTLFFLGRVPVSFLLLLAVPFVVFVAALVAGFLRTRRRYIPSRWNRLNGFFFYLTVTLFLLGGAWAVALAHALLIYAYVAAGKYFLEVVAALKAQGGDGPLSAGLLGGC